MKQRFAVTNKNGTMRLYYDDIEQAKQEWPDCEVNGIEDDIGHIQFIDNIMGKSIKTLIDLKNRTVCQLKFPWGWGLFRFSKDDWQWLDLCEYQLYNDNDKRESELWTLSQPEWVWNNIVNVEPTFILLQEVCKSKGGKLTRPKELKGIKQIGSVTFCKTKCSVYIVGDDIYMQHNDYFSPIWTPPDPEYRFAPLSVVVNHYFGGHKGKKFIYDDCWSSIVMRIIAWLKFQDYMPLFEYMKPNDVALLMRNQVFARHGFDTKKGAYQDWLIFLERVCNLINDNRKNN